MASLTTSALSALGGKLVVDLSVVSSNANNNVTSATSGRIYMIHIDNTGNSSAVYLKIMDASSATPSTSTSNGVGTPDFMFVCPANKKVTYAIPGGHPYASGVSMWASTSAVVGNTSAPTNSVIVKLVCS